MGPGYLGSWRIATLWQSDRHSEWGQPVEFVDNDISAWRSGTRRPRYQAMLEAVRTGELGRIVVYHVDRLYRQPRELEELIDLADAGQVEQEAPVVGKANGRTSWLATAGSFSRRSFASVVRPAGIVPQEPVDGLRGLWRLRSHDGARRRA